MLEKWQDEPKRAKHKNLYIVWVQMDRDNLEICDPLMIIANAII
jgi:uncharacterized protein (DUF1919 family)